MDSIEVTGWILTDDGFVQGTVTVEDGVIAAIGRRTSRTDRTVASGIILPRMVNAHTHIGDAVARGLPGLDTSTLEELVAPPDGLKHRRLNAASPAHLRAAMEQNLTTQFFSGTGSFFDFREGGPQGCAIVRDILKEPVHEHTLSHLSPVLLGRPHGGGTDLDHESIHNLIGSADGIGLSSIADWPSKYAVQLAQAAKEAGKPFALHVSEQVREPIEAVLDLAPDLIVHLCAATQKDIELVSQAAIPVAVCPRSNTFFGLRPKINELLEAGCSLCIGTDNAMLTPPSMLDELAFTYRLARLARPAGKSGTSRPGRSLAHRLVEALFSPLSATIDHKNAQQNDKKILNRWDQFRVVEGSTAQFVVLSNPGCDIDPYFTVAAYASAADLNLIVSGETMWQRQRGGWTTGPLGTVPAQNAHEPVGLL